MTAEREQFDHPEPQPPVTGLGVPDPGALEQLARRGDDFLAAGDEAIRRALSGDSEAFLKATRQQGGQ